MEKERLFGVNILNTSKYTESPEVLKYSAKMEKAAGFTANSYIKPYFRESFYSQNTEESRPLLNLEKI